ncbi:MAG: tripartite tricarboxylate transporter substrate binding protein [Desulfovibrio sp.]|jgi:tripartite-type tricarboxylate transporter receptor subunit TctC|nr:tripartite tricarboxylate transporter substrate binding protein [Desulfovibrio sp.]
MKKSRLLVLLCVMSTFLFVPALARADWRPTAVIRVLVPYNAGGQSDLYARKIGAIIQQQKLLPVNWLVVNMTGGSTQEALNTLYNAKPDGTTLLVHHSALLTQSALGQTKYKPEDFTSIAEFMENVSTLSVRGNAKWKNFEEFLAEGKANPGKLRIAMPGVGNVNHFMALDVLSRLNAANLFRFVPCNGGAEAASRLMGDQVEARFALSADAARFVRAGDERLLLILGVDPVKVFPDVPTAAKFGLKSSVVNRIGVQGPKGMPADMVKTLSAVIRKVTETKEFREFTEQQASETVYRDGKDWAPMQQTDLKAMQQIVSQIKK